MVLRVPETKNGDHFFMSTSPQNGGKYICSVRLSFLSGFYDFANFGLYQGRFPSLTAKKLKVFNV